MENLQKLHCCIHAYIMRISKILIKYLDKVWKAIEMKLFQYVYYITLIYICEYDVT